MGGQLTPTASSVTLPPFRLTVAQYHDMLRLNIIREGAPVELLRGQLVAKMGKNPPHRFTTQTLADILKEMVPAGWFVDVQEPLTTDDSEPEPDICVVRGSRRTYAEAGRHPGAQEIPIVIEVSDTTLATDRIAKAGIYAGAGFPEYWIVNLPHRLIEVYSDANTAASPAEYQTREEYHTADEVPVVLGGVEVGRVRVSEVLL